MFVTTAKRQCDALAHAVFFQIVYGSYSLSSIDSEHRANFVRYGFARHIAGIQEEVIDEPLMIFSALKWFNKLKQFSLLDRLRRDIEMHSPRRNGLEAYLAFYMRQLFEVPQTLDAVFTFRSDFASESRTILSWQRDKFELVTVVPTEDPNKPDIFLVTANSGPSSNIGFIAVEGKDVLEWIKVNSGQFTFCFPPPSCGPDVLFFVRCKSTGRLLLVAVQAKKRSGDVSLETLIKGLRTVSPPWFWKSKDLNVRHSWQFQTDNFLHSGNIKMPIIPLS